jgi:penicillin-binding protein 2
VIVKKFQGRLSILSIIIGLIFLVLIGRLGYLQIAHGQYYERLADGNRIRLIPVMAPRGTIYDRNGLVLVTTRPGFTVSLLEINEPISDEVIEKVSKILSMPQEEIKRRLKQHKGSFDPVRIRNDVGPEIVAMIEERRSDLPGVVIEIQPTRNYVYNETAAHVLGYVSEISDYEMERLKTSGYKTGDLIGKFGLEKNFDKELRGVDGGGQMEVDANGRPIQVLGKKNPLPGNNLVLTIDVKIQSAAEKAVTEHLEYLRNTLKNPRANAAAVVVMNPKNGEIMAMVSSPSFNPNLFTGGISNAEWKKINENPYNPMENKAIAGEYPPGSTFKVVTAAAALELGKTTPSERLFDSGQHWLLPKGNAGGKAFGWITFRQAFYMSTNIFFYELGYRLGIDNIEKYARMLGLGERTGVDLLGEAKGLVANRQYKRDVYKEDWYVSETFDAAIGQGFNLTTPLQMAAVISQFANWGAYYKPHLVKKVLKPDGTVLKEFEPELVTQLPISRNTLDTVRSSLRDSAVVPGGTSAFYFHDFPIAVAGKTGTAENPHGRDHAWFIAFAPYDNPTVAIAVLVDQGGFGSVAAVPIAKKIFENVFDIPPPVVPVAAGR